MLIEGIKIFFELIYYVMNICVILYAVYYIITGVFTFIGNKKHAIKRYKPKYKLAVIVAARNEEEVIGNLLDSLNKQNYPKELYDIFVIPNNCTDNTESIVKQKKCTIVECNAKVKSKGDVLKYAFEYMKINRPEYDAYIIFDADNIVHPEFLRRMNDTICSGYNVAQGNRDSKNPSDTWISSCYSMYYWVQNFFFNRARMNMGWSSSINGTGFMLTKEVLEKNGFNTITMTEDIEFAAQCAINNEKIAFVKDAVTYDEQPITFRQSCKQRKRWSDGTLQCLGHYFSPLVKTSITKNVPQAIDMALFFLAPVMQIVAIITFVMIAIYGILGININDLMTFMYHNGILSLVLGYVGCAVVSLFVVLSDKKGIKKSLKGILTLSIFMVTWIPINAISLFKKGDTWEPIHHHRNIDIDSVMQTK